MVKPKGGCQDFFVDGKTQVKSYEVVEKQFESLLEATVAKLMDEEYYQFETNTKAYCKYSLGLLFAPMPI